MHAQANPAHFNRDSHEIAVQERVHNHRGYIYLSSNTRVRNDTDYSILAFSIQRITLNRFLNCSWRSFFSFLLSSPRRKNRYYSLLSQIINGEEWKFSNCHVKQDRICAKLSAMRQLRNRGSERNQPLLSELGLTFNSTIVQSIRHNKFTH